VVQWIVDAINAWLQAVSNALLKPALQGAGQLLFTTPAFDTFPEVQTGWATVRDIADAFFVLAFIAAGILIIASGTLETQYTAKLMLPRVALAAVLANVSLFVCGLLIQLDNAIVTQVIGAAGAKAWSQLTSGATTPTITDAALAPLIGLVTAIIAVLLVIVFILRAAVILLSVVLAPLAIVCYTLPPLEEVAALWLRLLLASLFIQVIEAVLVSLGLVLMTHANWLGQASGLVRALIVITLLYLMVRLPFAAWKLASRRPPVVRNVIHMATPREDLWRA
jgi:hypothetical protein